MNPAGESAALLELFVDEARRFLASSPDASDAADAQSSLAQIARLLEGEPLGLDVAAAVAALAADHADPAARGRLGELAVAAADRVRGLRDRAPTEDQPSVDDGDAVPATLDDAFDTAEYRTLRNLFRDEARESLEAIARRLLEANAGPDRATLDELLRKAHSLKGAAGTVGLARFADAVHRLESSLDRLRRGARAWSGQLRDRLVEAVDELRAEIEAGEHDGELARGAPPSGAAAVRAIGRRADGHAGPPAAAVPAAAAPDAAAPAARVDGELTGRSGATTGPPRAEPAFLRVDPARIDRLMDAVGELIFDRTRIERRAGELGAVLGELERLRLAVAASHAELPPSPARDRLTALDAELEHRHAMADRAVAEMRGETDALRRTAAALQDGLTSVRMESARGLYQRLAPQLRAIARSAGKRVELITTGGETEFDKAVADEIVDPIIHLLRNAVAHAIEEPEVRLAAGKPAVGRVRVSARQEAGGVVVEVNDDGAGIDPEVLRRRLVANGRWTAARATLASDDEVLRALFDARLSSRAHADELAGRGIGLDAVREAIARLGGELEVRSTPGVGTTFTMRLPLTTAVSNALLFKVGGQVYAVPNVHVLETAQVEASSPTLPSLLRVRDEAVPLVVLHRVLGADVPGDARTVPAVVIEYVGRRLAMTCDKIVGPREIVVKSLGPLLASLPLFAGGTISGSGKVQLILDPSALVRIAYPELLPVPAPPRRPADAARVLLADDSRLVRESVRRVLEKAGYAVDAVDTGLAAWELLRAHRYHALITDLDMPELDGFALIERLRRDGDPATLPVVIITSRATTQAATRAGHLRVRALLEKPVSADRLLAALATR